MRITCKYSGLQLASYKHFSDLHLADIHPIFFVKQSSLFAMLPNWDTMQNEEKHLYYLALANSTGLVSFQIPAKPTRKVMESTITRLVTVAGWIAEFNSNWSRQYSIDFPRYRIASDNADCKNIAEWLAALEGCKQDWYDGKATVEHRHALVSLEDTLQLMIRNNVTSKKFTKMLADWAIDVSCEDTDVNKATKEFWLALMTTNKTKLYETVIQGHPVTTDDVDELIAHLEVNLPHGDSAVAYTVMQHVRDLRRSFTDGLGLYSILDDLGLGVNRVNTPTTIGSSQAASVNDNIVGDNAVNADNVNDNTQTAMPPRPSVATIALYQQGAPDIKQFNGNRLKYLLAKANYGTAEAEVKRYLAAGGEL